MTASPARHPGAAPAGPGVPLAASRQIAHGITVFTRDTVGACTRAHTSRASVERRVETRVCARISPSHASRLDLGLARCTTPPLIALASAARTFVSTAAAVR